MLSRIKSFFEKSPQMSELRGALRPYHVLQKKLTSKVKKFSPAILAIATNIDLPSSEGVTIPMDKFKLITKMPAIPADREQKNAALKSLVVLAASEPLIALYHSLPPLFKGYSTADLTGTLIVGAFFNRLQIWVNTGLEFFFRTAGAAAMWPAHKISKAIDEMKPQPGTFGEYALKAINFAVFSVFWCIGQTLTLVADVFSYTRQFIDSAIRLLNPLWWIGKVIGQLTGDTTPVPSFQHLAKTFVTSVLNLIPAIAIVVAGLLTGGVAVPILKSLAAPLHTVGSLVVNAVLTSSSLVANTIIGIGISGATAAAAKFFSACVRGFQNLIETACQKKEEDSAHSREKEHFIPKGRRSPPTSTHGKLHQKHGIGTASHAEPTASASIPPGGPAHSSRSSTPEPVAPNEANIAAAAAAAAAAPIAPHDDAAAAAPRIA